MNCALILVVLCGGLYLSHGEKLKCQFKDVGYSVGTLYSCKVTSLDNSFNNMTIDGYTGIHIANKNDNDVKTIRIVRTNTKYIPDGLGSLSHLTALFISNSQLVEIKAYNFLGMQNLEYLSLWDNKLTFVPSDAFSTLTKLKVIYLWYNQIKYIGSEVFNELTNLYKVGLNDNICVNKVYEGNSAIIQMKKDIKVNCMNPNDPHEIIINLKQENRELMKEKDALQKMAFELKKLQIDCEIKTQELMTKISESIKPSSETLVCEFKDEGYNILGPLYTCDVSSLDNQCGNKIITGHNGAHKVNKNDANVKAIWIFTTNTKYIPEGLGSLFNLTAFQMFHTQLMEIRTKDFRNMEHLEYLNFFDNKLTSVPPDAFTMLTKLKYINLQSNQISVLSPGLFSNNLDLDEVYLDDNKIKTIGSELFNGLIKMNRVYLTKNICLDKNYEGSTEMIQLREDTEINCKNPVDDTIV